jgi:hypothetical protein
LEHQQGHGIGKEPKERDCNYQNERGVITPWHTLNTDVPTA